MQIAPVLNDFIMPLAVIVSAAATTATATFAWRVYQLSQLHERALFGEEELDSHDGIVEAVNQNTKRTLYHRQILRESDAMDGAPSDWDETR